LLKQKIKKQGCNEAIRTDLVLYEKLDALDGGGGGLGDCGSDTGEHEVLSEA